MICNNDDKLILFVPISLKEFDCIYFLQLYTFILLLSHNKHLLKITLTTLTN